MFIIGIDIGKNNHEATVIDSSGNIVVKNIKFHNSHKGVDKLLSSIRKINSDFNSFSVGMEATGHYWLSLYARLLSEGFQINVINPIQSDSLRNLYIRQTKNDTVDSFIIAEVIRFGRFSTTQLADEDLLALKQLTRYRTYLVDSNSDLKRKAIAILDQLFPEYNKLFSDTFGKSSKELLLSHQTPDEIANLDTSELASFLSKVSKGRLSLDKATEIQEAARNSFGLSIASEAFAFQLKQLIEQIIFVENQIKQLDAKIALAFKSLNSFLDTIPGVGPVLGSIILSEIGDPTRFKSGAKLVAYAGIDPTVKQSGEFNSIHNRMSKRGSPHLRRAIWMAASVAIFNDPILNNFYTKKRNEGKHHLTAVGAVARKLTYIIFAVLRDKKPYTPIA